MSSRRGGVDSRSWCVTAASAPLLLHVHLKWKVARAHTSGSRGRHALNGVASNGANESKGHARNVRAGRGRLTREEAVKGESPLPVTSPSLKDGAPSNER